MNRRRCRVGGFRAEGFANLHRNSAQLGWKIFIRMRIMGNRNVFSNGPEALSLPIDIVSKRKRESRYIPRFID